MKIAVDSERALSLVFISIKTSEGPDKQITLINPSPRRSRGVKAWLSLLNPIWHCGLLFDNKVQKRLRHQTCQFLVTPASCDVTMIFLASSLGCLWGHPRGSGEKRWRGMTYVNDFPALPLMHVDARFLLVMQYWFCWIFHNFLHPFDVYGLVWSCVTTHHPVELMTFKSLWSLTTMDVCIAFELRVQWLKRNCRSRVEGKWTLWLSSMTYWWRTAAGQWTCFFSLDIRSDIFRPQHQENFALKCKSKRLKCALAPHGENPDWVVDVCFSGRQSHRAWLMINFPRSRDIYWARFCHKESEVMWPSHTSLKARK